MVAGAIATGLLLSACGSATDGGPAAAPGGSADDVAAALEEGGELVVWGWDATLPATVEAFEEAYPNVDVELANVGTGNDQYSQLQNAISAGSGVPDVVHLEYSAVPQFALANSLADLAAYGASELEAEYTPGTWGSVALGDGVYGLPMDSGPMALFYNQEVFEEHGIEVPETWDEFMEAARTVRAADSGSYLIGDAGDAGFTMSMIWQAGGQPFKAEGTDVTVDLADEGAQRYTQLWQQMLDEELVAPITTWTDEWYQALGDGTIATLAIGAWMPAMLESGVPGAAGKWRVAPLPQWEAGAAQTAENGGSALAVTDASTNKALAYGFVEFANAGDGVQVRLDQGTFPATTADLQSEEFLNREFEYFGGQKVNEVLAESAANVLPGWSYLPYQPYATSIFNDHVGRAYVSDVTLEEGLQSWEDAIVEYGNQQGFNVSTR
jgi:multiple sugar transport system substrate-binding protein